jgi:GT2 family glycosyltransferase
MIVRTEIIRRIGGFDEGFFLYGEDQDLCLRIRRAGWEIGHIETALVTHYGGESERPTGPVRMWEKKVRAENIFFRKHYQPQTIARIRRAELLKALYRMATLRLLLPFSADPERERAKLARYKIIYDVTRQLAAEERTG